MSGELRVALVGTGGVAHQHMRGYRSAANDVVEVVAACDPRADVLDAFAAEHGIPHTYRDFDSMLDEQELDIVVLLTPPAVRDEIIYPSLERGVNLLVEKPFGATGAKAVEYALAAERSGVTLAVGQNFRWFPEHQWLHDRLKQPDAGRIEYVEARSFQDRPQAVGQWRAQEQKLEMAIFSVHLIDRLQWIAPGAPVAVSALTRRRRGSGISGEQFTSLLVDFDDDSVGHLTSSWLSRSLPINDLRVDTDTGSAHVWREKPMHGTGFAEAEFSGERDTAEFPTG
jgi:predicted dehydrogenase